MNTEPRPAVNLAYELRHQYSVTQTALFNAIVDAATLRTSGVYPALRWMRDQVATLAPH